MIDFLEEANKRKEQMIEDIKTLCCIPSVLDNETAGDNQPFGASCRQALDAMLAIGQRDGFECVDVDGYAGHIDIGNQEDTFGVLGHLDVVPCNPTGWETDPYNPVIIDGKMYGRGVADDKGPLLAGYYAAKIIHELNIPVKMKTRIIFGCNEESGSNCVKYYFQKMPFPKMGFTPDADFPVVYGEKAMMHFEISGEVEKDNIIGIYAGTRSNIVPGQCEAYVAGSYKQYKETFQKYLQDSGLEGYIEEEGNHTKLFLQGRSAHASMPELGINAAAYMCHYLATISHNQLVHMIDQYFFDDTKGEKVGIDFEGEMGPLTLNLGILNYKDQQVKIVLDLRVPHEEKEEDMVEKMQAVVDQYQLNLYHEYTKALYVNPQSELIQKLHGAYVEFSGDHEHGPQAVGGGTYAKAMPNCVAFGPQFPDTDNKIHQDNEEISIDDLVKATAIYAKAIYELIKE